MYHALLLHAVDAWQEHVGAGGDEGEDERFPEPAELDRFMLDRATACPLAWVSLLWMRIHELIMLGEETEGASDFETWRQLIPLFQQIFAVTNATHYTPMMGFEMQEWDRACKAAREVHTRWGFTQKTVGGKRVWSDRLVEWVVRAARMRLGKKVAAGHEAGVKRVFFQMEDQAAARAGADSRRKKGSEPVVRQVVLSEVFVKVYEGVKKVRIFNVGGEIFPLNRTGGVPRGSFVDIQGEALNGEFYKVLQTAQARTATVNGHIQQGRMPPPGGLRWVRALQRTEDETEYAEWVRDYSSLPIPLFDTSIRLDDCKDVLRAAKTGSSQRVRDMFKRDGTCKLSGTRKELVGFVANVRRVMGEELKEWKEADRAVWLAQDSALEILENVPNGEWWNATVVGVKPGSVKIHYLEGEKSDDEWLKTDSVRLRQTGGAHSLTSFQPHADVPPCPTEPGKGKKRKGAKVEAEARVQESAEEGEARMAHVLFMHPCKS